MMRTRKEILNDLVFLNDDIAKLQLELSQFPWDIINPIITVNNSDIYRILTKFVFEKTNFITIEDWANAIECREDLDFENDALKEIITEIANPALFEKLDSERLKQFIIQVDSNGDKLSRTGASV